LTRTIALTLAFLLTAPAVLAWGEKGHLMVNEAATRAVPNDMPAFFYKAFSRLTYLGPEPDRWYTGHFASIGAANFPEHFINYEYVDGLTLPADRYKFIDLLYSSGTLKKYGIGNATTGFAPWRIAELCEMLTVEWRLWRNSQPGAEREQIEENIIHIAGTLGHYAGDTSNPHHTTIHYNGWVGATNPEHFRTDCDTHARFEHYFVTRAIELSDVLPYMSAPTLRADYFATAIQHVKESNALVKTLYRIDRDGGFDSRDGNPEAREFAGRRLAAGASMLRDLWWSSWRNSAAPLVDWHTP
jgi:hypothetical protein